jgi:hypothetical protein
MEDDRLDLELPSYPLETPERLALRAGPLTFSLAQTYEDLRQAYGLVYRNYLRAEYIDRHESQMRYAVFNALPETDGHYLAAGGRRIAGHRGAAL